ncbi:hypothetical protein RhiirC2_850647 [Rhizophagus irregularis]|uniref:Uncharacterized protein n=1 Tax=Rhizophagus irregularis TaxID=588596 RepID=A0A2N1N6S4_9GLOM|nr:hypothetical protein RhiirC2_850647 [Rhizophagus irregularis]
MPKIQSSSYSAIEKLRKNREDKLKSAKGGSRRICAGRKAQYLEASLNLWPNRQYVELDKFADERIKKKSVDKPIDEEEVVNLIKKWIVGDDLEVEKEENKVETSKKKNLKKDNIPTDGVVEVINKYRVDEKIKTEAIEEMKDVNGLKTDEEFKDWVKAGDQYNNLGRRIISLAEQSETLNHYTTLNENVTKRLKNENKATDGKDKGDKRVKNSPSEKKFKKR